MYTNVPDIRTRNIENMPCYLRNKAIAIAIPRTAKRKSSIPVLPRTSTTCAHPEYETYESGFHSNVLVSPKKQYCFPFSGVHMYAVQALKGFVRKETTSFALQKNTSFTRKSAAPYALPHTSVPKNQHVQGLSEIAIPVPVMNWKSVALFQ